MIIGALLFALALLASGWLGYVLGVVNGRKEGLLSGMECRLRSITRPQLRPEHVVFYSPTMCHHCGGFLGETILVAEPPKK